MNTHVGGMPWEEEGQNLLEAIDRLGFIAEMVAEHYGLCTHCLILALAARIEAEDENDDGDEE